MDLGAKPRFLMLFLYRKNEYFINIELHFLCSRTDPDIKKIKENIVKRYKFVKVPNKDVWQSQPTFQEALGTPLFKKASDDVKDFFKRNPDWETTKTKFRTVGSCIDLLYITAARYLLVTQILYEQSGKKLIPCARTEDKRIVVPDSGVCYPAPYGSATCTSDYDVGLIGKDAGTLTKKFNTFFQGADGFGKPSELVFDTNVYAFTLEFAMPLEFDKLPAYFAEEVTKKEQTVNFKMQELASAFYKVFKYNPGFFEVLKTGALGALDPAKASQSKIILNNWLKTFARLNNKVKMRIEDYNNSPLLLRQAHNVEYQELVKNMSDEGGYKQELLGICALTGLVRQTLIPPIFFFLGGGRGGGEGWWFVL